MALLRRVALVRHLHSRMRFLNHRSLDKLFSQPGMVRLGGWDACWELRYSRPSRLGNLQTASSLLDSFLPDHKVCSRCP